MCDCGYASEGVCTEKASHYRMPAQCGRLCGVFVFVEDAALSLWCAAHRTDTQPETLLSAES